MSTIINTNAASHFALLATRSASQQSNQTISKLATGKRINRASDDAAGLSINEKLTAKLRGITKAEANIADALGFNKSVGDLIYGVTEDLQQVRELWVKAKNGTNKGEELDTIQREINGRIKSIEDKGQALNNSLLPSNFFTGRSLEVQTGSNANERLTLDYDNTTDPNNYVDTRIDIITPGGLSDGASTVLSHQQVGAPNVPAYWGGGAGVISGNIDDIDKMIKNASRMASVIAKYDARLTTAYNKIQDERSPYSAYQSQIQDIDYAEAISTYAKDELKQKSAASIMTQANAQVGLSLNLLP